MFLIFKDESNIFTCSVLMFVNAFLFLKFQRCTVDPSEEVNKIMANLKVTFVEGYSAVCPSADSKTTLAEYRFSLGAKLYLKVLETILLTVSNSHIGI